MDDSASPVLQAGEIVAVLERHRVEYVVLGGYAAVLHGSTRPTNDIDVMPRTSVENLDRLAAALQELGARIRSDQVPGGLPFATSGEALAGMKMLNLMTPLGELDLTFEPAGIDGFDDLNRSAVTLTIGQTQVRIAALADVIRSKTAAARRKDLDALPELHALAGHPSATSMGSTMTPAARAAQGFPTPVTGTTPGDAAARIAAARAAAQTSRDGDQQARDRT